ncbi:uncharacterized protein LOC143265291, partial [Megachile rotundata]|uniref:uncharacterized protein LOC143265291 n=1 Tax=Megachile rotundata TaxID=143995 RepID=UPI003FD62067
KLQDQDIYKRVHRAKHNNEQYDTPITKINHQNEYTITTENDLNIEPEEEVYDYGKFKKEYEEQIAEDITTNNKTFNDTEKKQEQPKEILKKLFSYENCTEVSKKLGIKAVDCLINNYEHEMDKPVVKKTLSKIWLIIKVWFLIYICLAIPCWCHKGWCCWCLRCNVFFPRKRIRFAKKYYATNPPGILSMPTEKTEEKQLITYEPTEFEEDAYKIFEAAIRNI